MLPMRISVSLAPGSYFFCAAAGDANSPHVSRAISARVAFPMASSLRLPSSTPSHQFADAEADETGRAGRHQIDHPQWEDSVDLPRQTLRDRLGNVRDEQHEQPAHESAGDRGNAADHQPD